MRNKSKGKTPTTESSLKTRFGRNQLLMILVLAVFCVCLFTSSAFAGQTPYNSASMQIRNVRASNSDGNWNEPQYAAQSSISNILQCTSVSKINWTTWTSLWQRLIGYFNRNLTPSENGTNNQSPSTQSGGAS